MNWDSSNRDIELLSFETSPETCSYLPAEQSRYEYRVMIGSTPEFCGELLRRGWRRFGTHFFRPICSTCRACRPLRVDVHQFLPSKSQRKTFRRNEHIRLQIQKPTITDDHLRLFREYHADMQTRRGWPLHETNASAYESSFVENGEAFGREFQYWNDDRLVGIGLVDETPVGLSSVYFYHDPAWRSLAPGVYSLLREIEYAQAKGLPHLYLGYWVAGCQSMNYKANYYPHQLLEQIVIPPEPPHWRSAGGE